MGMLGPAYTLVDLLHIWWKADHKAFVDTLWSQPTALLILFSICLYYASVGFYRLYLSPIAKLPGPTLVVLTYWYEFYHNVPRRGQFIFAITKMHEKNGEC